MIPVRNIYYMLSYAFQSLKGQGYEKLATEEFENAADLCAAILVKGLSIQLKRGLRREYVPQTEALSSLRGKLDVSASVKSLTLLKKQMVCAYDEFSVDNDMNRAIRSTLFLLLKADIAKSRKKELRKLLVYLDDVGEIDLHTIDWNMQYNRNDQTYRLLIAICYLVVKGLLQAQSDGNLKMMDFLDEQRICRLYEKFIFEYYRKEFPTISVAASQISWQLDDDMADMLPIMRTDVTLSYKKRVLIVDAKYYAQATQTQFGAHTIHSGNLYQMFTYVKNKSYELQDQGTEVSGMLLYAKTDEPIVPDNEYRMSGNKISVKTLDLNCDFDNIRKQLNAIVEEHFPE